MTLNGSPLEAGVLTAPITIEPPLTALRVRLTNPRGAWRDYLVNVARPTPEYQCLAPSVPGSRFGSYGGVQALDSATLVVGAPGTSAFFSIPGTPAAAQAAFVYSRGAGAWHEQSVLRASQPDIGDRFGASVALSGDTLVVGAPGEDGGADGDQASNDAKDSGAAYVFSRDGAGVWAQEAYLKPATVAPNQSCGTSVALDGDTLALGCNTDPCEAIGSGPCHGTVYVFTRAAGVWTQQARLTAEHTGQYDDFGRAVALAGDFLVVGAAGESSDALGVGGDATRDVRERGAAYVFRRVDGVWSQEAYLKPSTYRAAWDPEGFGWSVDIDVIGPERVRVAVGAPWDGGQALEPPGAEDTPGWSGTVELFERDGSGNWSFRASVGSSDAHEFDQFGTSVSMDADYLAVGSEQGTYLYRRGSWGFFDGGFQIWTEQARLNAPTQSGLPVGLLTVMSGGRVVNLHSDGADESAVCVLR